MLELLAKKLPTINAEFDELLSTQLFDRTTEDVSYRPADT
jgi:hypothetical protein